MSDLIQRLRELSDAVTKQDWSQFTMRVPVDTKRDADVVLAEAADELERLETEVEGLETDIRAAAKLTTALMECPRYYTHYMGYIRGVRCVGCERWYKKQELLEHPPICPVRKVEELLND